MQLWQIENYITNTSCRYTDIKQDIAEELDSLRHEGAELENVTTKMSSFQIRAVR